MEKSRVVEYEGDAHVTVSAIAEALEPLRLPEHDVAWFADVLQSPDLPDPTNGTDDDRDVAVLRRAEMCVARTNENRGAAEYGRDETLVRLLVGTIAVLSFELRGDPDLERPVPAKPGVRSWVIK